MSDGVKLSRNAARKTAEAVRTVLGSRKPLEGTGSRRGDDNVWYYAKLASDLTAGTLETPSTFDFDVWLPDPDNEPAFIESPDTDLLGLTGYNRSSMTGTTGTMIKVEYAHEEWSIKWADC